MAWTFSPHIRRVVACVRPLGELQGREWPNNHRSHRCHRLLAGSRRSPHCDVFLITEPGKVVKATSALGVLRLRWCAGPTLHDPVTREDHVSNAYGRHLARPVPTLERTRVMGYAATACLAVLAIAASSILTSRAEVIVEVDGVSQPVVTWGGTVASVLAGVGYTPGAHDLVSPARDEAVKNGQTVVVRTAKPFDITVDGVSTTVWSTSSSVDSILADAGLTGGAVTMAANRSSARGTLPSLVSRARTIGVVDAGVRSEVTVQPGQDVRVALQGAGVDLSPIDQVALTSTAGALEVVVTRVKRGVETIPAQTSFPTEEVQSADLFEGERVVQTLGQPGIDVVTRWAESFNGKIVHSAPLSHGVQSEPIAEVTAIGTKEATPEALVKAGLDPKATLEEGVEDNGTPSVRYRAKLGTISSAAEIAEIRGAAAAAGLTGIPTVYSGEDPRSIAAPLVAARGWSEGEFQCLVALWNHESGWNPYAANPSGAYGIPQALPGSKMASAGADWQTNPATQISWGLGYIQGRYGTPCGAYSHWQSKNWY